MKVFIKGTPRRVGGIRRYSQDLAGCLRDKGMLTATRPANVFHAVQPIALPEGRHFVVTCLDLAPLNKANSSAANLNSFSARIFAKLFKLRVERSFRRADAIIAISTQTNAEIQEAYPAYAGKTRLINPGISEKFKPSRRKERDVLRIGYYGSTRFGLEKVADILNRSGVHFSLSALTGTKEDEIAAYYNSLDYFVDFAPYRGFGYPILEARACGVTVMTLKSAMIPAEVKALTIQVEDEREAADAIVSGASQSYQVIPFTLERMASETTATYQEILTSG